MSSLPLRIILRSLRFAVTFGTVERAPISGLDEVSDADLAVEMLTRQNLRLPEVLGAQRAGQLVVQLLETLGKEILSVLRHCASTVPWRRNVVSHCNQCTCSLN